VQPYPDSQCHPPWKPDPYDPTFPLSPSSQCDMWNGISAPQYPPSVPQLIKVENYQQPFHPGWTTDLNPHGLQSPDSTAPHIWLPDPVPADHDGRSINPSSSSSPTPPVSAVPPVLLPLSNGAGSPEDSLQDGQLGVSLSIQRKKAYVDAYRRYFHPLFPIIHWQRFTQYTQVRGAKLLLAAMMAIGAQYAQELFAGSDSRILHEKCQELIVKVWT
jgi:hypothetical protein